MSPTFVDTEDCFGRSGCGWAFDDNRRLRELTIGASTSPRPTGGDIGRCARSSGSRSFRPIRNDCSLGLLRAYNIRCLVPAVAGSWTIEGRYRCPGDWTRRTLIVATHAMDRGPARSILTFALPGFAAGH